MELSKGWVLYDLDFGISKFIYEEMILVKKPVVIDTIMIYF